MQHIRSEIVNRTFLYREKCVFIKGFFERWIFMWIFRRNIIEHRRLERRRQISYWFWVISPLLQKYMVRFILYIWNFVTSVIFPSTFLQPVNGNENSILNWAMHFNFFMCFYLFETLSKDFPLYAYSPILLTLWFRYLQTCI